MRTRYENIRTNEKLASVRLRHADFLFLNSFMRNAFVCIHQRFYSNASFAKHDEFLLKNVEY